MNPRTMETRPYGAQSDPHQYLRFASQGQAMARND